MKYYLKTLAFVVLLVVGVVAFAFESIIKIGAFAITTVIAVVWMLLAPLVVNLTLPKWFSDFIEYSFSWNYNITGHIIKAYTDALQI